MIAFNSLGLVNNFDESGIKDIWQCHNNSHLLFFKRLFVRIYKSSNLDSLIYTLN